jgi:hypothetical protein
MEGLKAFSLTGNILEFARFGIDLLTEGREFYKSSHGTLSANEQLELATADMRALVAKFKTREGLPASGEDEEDPKTFQQVLCGAGKVAEELLLRLEGLKVKGMKDRKWESVRKAMSSVLTRHEMEALKNKLVLYRDAVQTHIIFSLV